MTSPGGPAAAEDLRRWRRDPAEDNEEEDNDHVDRLPDSVLLLVFNRVSDVKDLGRCCVVCSRFHSLVRLVDSVLVRVDCVISDDPSPSPAGVAGGDSARGVFSHLARVVLGGIASSSSPLSEFSHHSPAEVLRNFKEIRRLRIELPAGELGVDDGVLLKWKAEFGSTLDSCLILSASSSFYTNGNLKLRVFWTISSLIAASARHYLLQPIVADHETLESLELTDVDGQGVLTMDRRQLQEFRVKPVSASGSSQRTLVPALSMRLWYAPYLELPGGAVLKGATLVAVRPSQERWREVASSGECGGSLGSSDRCWISSAFEEPYRSAAGTLVKGRTYCLEMNSF
ncbi:hypothetical protein BHM03_00017325 [Ensete ventricosum]|nr:hypothetical protein BHM03_00017325 [Ensete ventricosum]